MSNTNALRLSLATLLLAPTLAAPQNTPQAKTQMVTVEPGVQLEVLDLGGSGPPLIFLARHGDTAHSYDQFAPRFTNQHHVYAITRRGFGASSKPAPANGNYSPDRRGNDILAVMQALHIDRPVLVGHSMAGEELSSVASRFPQKVAGLIYLDAASSRAFYDPSHPQLEIEMNDIKARIDQIEAGGVDEQQKLRELEPALDRFSKILHEDNEALKSMPPLPPRSPIDAALNFGVQRYTSIHVPVLAIFACPHDWSRIFANDPARMADRVALDTQECNARADAITHGIPGSVVVRIPKADHYVYRSNETQVIDAMRKFLESLH